MKLKGKRCHIVQLIKKVYKLVVKSNLKLAAYGHKFLKNYQDIIVKFIRRMNEMQYDIHEDETKSSKFRCYLSKTNAKHIITIYWSCHICGLIASTQHGVSTVNQLPWEYDDKVESKRRAHWHYQFIIWRSTKIWRKKLF